MQLFTEYAQTIYKLLADNRLEKLGLLQFSDDSLNTPVTGKTSTFLRERSKRAERVVPVQTVRELLTAIQARGHYQGINHIGFCYKVASQADEILKITNTARTKGLSVYQEPSIDEAAWLFVGDISTDIASPLLELLPVEGTPKDPWVDYYLPHIQFDVDTGLSADEIATLVKKYIRQPGTPYSITIDGFTYIQRVNLGCTEGVNIMLDLSTDNRDINYRKTWDKLT